MKSKIIALVLIFCILNSVISVTASGYEPFVHGYSAGDYLFTVDASDCTSKANVTSLEDGVKISAGGTAVYGFFLPFDSRSVTIKYSNASGTTTIDSGYRKYYLELSGDGEYALDFGENLGYEDQNYYYVSNSYAIREFTEKLGEREFVVESTGGIVIESLVFEKEKTPTSYSTNSTTGEVTPVRYSLSDVSDEVMDLLSTVMIDTKSPIIVVNGGRRYVNNNDISVTPYNNNGTLYLPINTLAKALGYYSEDIPDKGYALLRDDNNEFTLIEGKAYLRINGGNPKSVTEPIIMYINGQTWAAVRYFAELKGDTVGYKEGLVVIDDKYTVEKTLSDSDYYSYVASIFNEFKEEKIFSNTYYVAKTANASDSNTGSYVAPFETLAKAASVAEAGDTVIIREGVYRETLMPENNGTASNPITFRAADGERVIISAADELNSFTLYKDNIYTAPMNWDLGNGKNQLFVNGISMAEAKYPNAPQWRSEGLSDLWPVRGDMQVSMDDTSVITSDTLLDQEDGYWDGAYYVGVCGNGYSLATATIDSSTNGQLKIKDPSEMWWWEPKETEYWNYGCIIGHMNALDISNEWVKQGDNVYLIFPEGVTSENAKIEAKARQLVIDVSDKKYINIENIETIGGSIAMNNSEMCMLNGLNMKYITHYTLSNDQRDGYIDFPRDVKNPDGAPQRGEVGIYMGGTDNIIVNTHIDHSAGAGIYVTGLYSYIENNILNDCGYMGSYVSGININQAGTDEKTTPRGGHAIYNNTVYNCGRSCLNIGHIESLGHNMAPYLPMEIAYNDFHDGIMSSLDTGLTYEYGVVMGIDKLKTEFHHNYIYTTQTKEDENPFASGIYHDGGAHGTATHHNLIFNTEEDAGFSMRAIFQQSLHSAPAYNDIYNNKTYEKSVGDVNAMTSKHFPQEQMFYAGADLETEHYLANYKNAKNDIINLKYNVSKAVLSDGVILENGIARFTDDNQYICFENVDFGSGADVINLTVYGDKNYSCDEIEIAVGNTIDEVHPVTYDIQVNSPKLDTPDNFDLLVGYYEGVKNVYIKVTDYKSLGIGGISLVGLSENGESDCVYSAKKYAVDYTNYTSGEGYAPTKVNFSSGEYYDFYHSSYMKNTYPGTIFEYQKMYFNSDASQFVIALGTGTELKYLFQKIYVYIDDMDEPICTYIVGNNDKNMGWENFAPVTVSLNTAIKAGTHDVYIKFADTNYSAATTNFYYFGFLPDGVELN